MGSGKTPVYYLEQIIGDIEFVLDKVGRMSLDEFAKDELLNCAVSFKFVQISEAANRLLAYYPELRNQIPYSELMGLRNRIVHDYGNVRLDIAYHTVFDDLPGLLSDMRAFASSIKNSV